MGTPLFTPWREANPAIPLMLSLDVSSPPT